MKSAWMYLTTKEVFVMHYSSAYEDVYHVYDSKEAAYYGAARYIAENCLDKLSDEDRTLITEAEDHHEALRIWNDIMSEQDFREFINISDPTLIMGVEHLE